MATQVFNAGGTFTAPAGVTTIDVLVVGGGGAGGGHYGGAGGGGAGGVRIITGIAYTVPLTVVVGAGAPNPTTTLQTGADGSPSSIAGYTALGGGGGGAWEGNPGGNAGRAGGSGGGGGGGGTGTGGAGTAGQGFKGGNGLETGLGHLNAGAGGGGAGAAGANAITHNTATAGGVGVDVSALFGAVGAAGFVGGGGGGSCATNTGIGGVGGQGGGGRGYGTLAGTLLNPLAGTANTGGGGGAGEHDAGIKGMGGGSGLVVVRYDVPAAPDAPTNLIIDPDCTTVDLSWMAPVAGAGVTGYEVTVNGGTPVDVGNVLTYEVTGLTPDTAYTFDVVAYNGTGDSPALSGSASTDPPPDPPTGLVQDGATLTSVTVEWVAPVAAPAPDSYEYRVDGGAPTDIGNVLTYEITGLATGVTYDIEVRSVGCGASDWVSVEATTLSPPNPPTDLEQTGATTTSVTVEWVAPVSGPAPTSYEYRINGGAPVDVGLALSVTVGPLSIGTAYLFEVRSIGANGESVWVALVVHTTDPPPPIATPSCFALVRGSGLRVTGLDRRGQVPDPIPFATSKSVVKVSIAEVSESGSTEIFKNPEDEKRLRFVRPTQTIRHTVDIEFLRVDPGVYSIVAGVPMVYSNGSLGFGGTPFGEGPFGEGLGDGDVVGFDTDTHKRPASFALEVWSKLAGRTCADGSSFYGYTLFPHLKGGRLSGFRFANGLVSFNLIGAQTRRASRWGVGPHDLIGPFDRLLSPVSRNSSYQVFVTPGQPPIEVCGMQSVTDVLDNGDAANPMPDPEAPFIVDGGAAETSAYIIDGGRA